MLSDARDKLKRSDGKLVTAILVIAVLYFARDVFIPLVLAGLLAFLLAPAATRLERWGVNRILAALSVILLSLAGTAVLGWVVLGQIYNLALELPQYQQNVTGKLESLHLNSAGRLTSTVEMLTSLGKQIKNGGVGPSSATVPRQRAGAHASTTSMVPVEVLQLEGCCVVT